MGEYRLPCLVREGSVVMEGRSADGAGFSRGINKAVCGQRGTRQRQVAQQNKGAPRGGKWCSVCGIP